MNNEPAFLHSMRDWLLVTRHDSSDFQSAVPKSLGHFNPWLGTKYETVHLPD